MEIGNLESKVLQDLRTSRNWKELLDALRAKIEEDYENIPKVQALRTGLQQERFQLGTKVGVAVKTALSALKGDYTKLNYIKQYLDSDSDNCDISIGLVSLIGRALTVNKVIYTDIGYFKWGETESIGGVQPRFGTELTGMTFNGTMDEYSVRQESTPYFNIKNGITLFFVGSPSEYEDGIIDWLKLKILEIPEEILREDSGVDQEKVVSTVKDWMAGNVQTDSYTSLVTFIVGSNLRLDKCIVDLFHEVGLQSDVDIDMSDGVFGTQSTLGKKQTNAFYSKSGSLIVPVYEFEPDRYSVCDNIGLPMDSTLGAYAATAYIKPDVCNYNIRHPYSGYGNLYLQVKGTSGMSEVITIKEGPEEKEISPIAVSGLFAVSSSEVAPNLEDTRYFEDIIIAQKYAAVEDLPVWQLAKLDDMELAVMLSNSKLDENYLLSDGEYTKQPGIPREFTVTHGVTGDFITNYRIIYAKHTQVNYSSFNLSMRDYLSGIRMQMFSFAGIMRKSFVEGLQYDYFTFYPTGAYKRYKLRDFKIIQNDLIYVSACKFASIPTQEGNYVDNDYYDKFILELNGVQTETRALAYNNGLVAVLPIADAFVNNDTVLYLERHLKNYNTDNKITTVIGADIDDGEINEQIKKFGTAVIEAMPLVV